MSSRKSEDRCGASSGRNRRLTKYYMKYETAARDQELATLFFVPCLLHGSSRALRCNDDRLGSDDT